MDMNAYLVESRYAADQTIRLIWSEYEQLLKLRSKIDTLTEELEREYRRVEWLVGNPDLDDDNLATAIYWDTYFALCLEGPREPGRTRCHSIILHKCSIRLPPPVREGWHLARPSRRIRFTR